MPNGGMAFYLLKLRVYVAFFSTGLTPVLISQTAAQYVDPKSKFLMLTGQG